MCCLVVLAIFVYDIAYDIVYNIVGFHDISYDTIAIIRYRMLYRMQHRYYTISHVNIAKNIR